MSEFTSLAQIRQAEAEVARRIAAARQAAEVAVREAQAQAADLKRQASEAGQCEGEAQSQEIISKAWEKARALSEQARIQAEGLRKQGNLRMETGVRCSVLMVTGLEEVGDTV
jgi:hypothetical protein